MLSSLDNQRAHVLGILDALPEEMLRRAVLPSGWTCRGMVRHLALSVERFWLREIVAGESFERADPDLDAQAAWHVPASLSADDVFSPYREEIARANAIITSTPLDAPLAKWRDDLSPNWRLHNLREVVVHVITETACHAGHLDAARELLDGRLWLS